MTIYYVTPRLGEILKEKKITQSKLAEMTGINQGTISRFDKNSQHLDVHLVSISRALDIQIEELFHIMVSDRGSQMPTKKNPNLRTEDKYYVDIDLD